MKPAVLVRCCLAACTLLAGCQITPQRATKEGIRDGVVHVVIFWLKQPGDKAARRRVIEASKTFEALPGVVRVEAGEMLPSPRPNVDKSFDVAVVMWLRDRRALEDYQVHPRHTAMLREVGPVVERVVAYDFETSSSRAQK